MKKLMVALAAVVLSTTVFAGAVNWKVNYVVDPSTGADYTGGVAYLFNVSDLSVAAVTAALDDGTFSASSAVYTDTFEDGSISDLNILNGTYSGSTTLYTVILDGAYDFDNGGNYIVTSVATQTIGASGAKNFKYDLSGDTSDWTHYGKSGPSPIPEPTSGLLMLLGVAGISLRRKCA